MSLPRMNGPWTAHTDHLRCDDAPFELVSILDADGGRLAQMTRRGPEGAQAARLMAAAPELYEALLRLSAHFTEPEGRWDQLDAADRDLLAAQGQARVALDRVLRGVA